jgi:chromosome segregation ATPase
MSLTEQARSPFSLVDEINQVRFSSLVSSRYADCFQGMDMRAERAVHNAMVEVTCNPDSAQYFLITPKLLPDLVYHERMKVLCVNNGEWLPEEKHIGDMMGMVEACAQRRNRSVNAA